VRSRLRVLASLVAVASASGSTGCSSSTSSGDGGGSDTGVSFAKDVMPVLQQNCTSNGCHGIKFDSSVEILYLGAFADGSTVDPSTAMTVYAGLVGVKSLEDPSMNLVTANEPQSSYLIAKLNGTQDSLASDCAKAPSLCPSATCTSMTPCGTQMPYLNAPLMTSDPTGMASITEWVTKGAKDN
jgi:hypothetical protein